MPCPVGFTLSITAGRLSSTLLIRSSDVFVGLPYDVMGHALLMQAVMHSVYATSGRKSIKGLGYMQVSLAHPHLYDCHVEMAKQALASEPCDDALIMPDWSVGRIAAFPDAYVAEVTELARHLERPTFSCRPEVVA